MAKMAELSLSVVPRASADTVGPYADGVLRVRVTQPATGGAANRAAMKLLGRALRVPPSTLRLVSGERSRRKRVAVDALDQVELDARLLALGD